MALSIEEVEERHILSILNMYWDKTGGYIPPINDKVFGDFALDTLEETIADFKNCHEVYNLTGGVEQMMKPAVVLVNTKDMERADWLNWRKRGLGGSDAGAVLGLGNPKYSSPMKVYLDKTGQLPPDDSTSEQAEAGNRLEPVVAGWFQDKMADAGKPVEVRERHELLQHADYPFMLANVDREIICPERGLGLLECKTADKYFMDEWEEDRIPDTYYIQVQHYLAVEPRYQFAYIACLVGGNRFVYKEIERDEEVISYLIQMESDFWRRVENQTPPAVDGSEATTDALKLIYSESVASKVELEDEVEEWLAQLEQIKANKKQLETQESEVQNRILSALQENEIGLIDGVERITWKPVTSERVDSKLLKELFPDVYNQVKKPSTYRRFMVKKLKKVKEAI